MLGTLTQEEIDALLHTANFGHLACNAQGKTYIVPISFAVEDSNTLVGQTTPGLKVDIMRENPEVCICVDEIKDLTNWRSVIAWGTYEELSGIQAAQAMGLLIDKYGPIFEDAPTPDRRGRVVTPPRLDEKPSTAIVYRITIKEKTGRFEKGCSSDCPNCARDKQTLVRLSS
jgi:nitroimidazol reductase NimA-like FMN-containing flavoprotein (pyridoxamine 5'-phosphate oxidase superfamily)